MTVQLPAISMLLVLAVSAIAALFDLRTRRIPNALPIALALGALSINAFAGWRAELAGVAVILAVLLVGTVAFSFRLIGGGDIKLIAAAAGALGFPLCVPFFFSMFICGGILAVLFAATRGQLRATLGNVGAIAIPLMAGVAPVRPGQSSSMPYALAIFSGAGMLALLGAFAPHLRILP